MKTNTQNNNHNYNNDSWNLLSTYYVLDAGISNLYTHQLQTYESGTIASFMYEETKVQSDKVTCSRSHSSKS